MSEERADPFLLNGKGIRMRLLAHSVYEHAYRQASLECINSGGLPFFVLYMKIEVQTNTEQQTDKRGETT